MKELKKLPLIVPLGLFLSLPYDLLLEMKCSMWALKLSATVDSWARFWVCNVVDLEALDLCTASLPYLYRPHSRQNTEGNRKAGSWWQLSGNSRIYKSHTERSSSQNSFLSLYVQRSIESMAYRALFHNCPNRFLACMPHNVSVFHIWRSLRKESTAQFRLGNRYTVYTCFSFLVYRYAKWSHHLCSPSNLFLLLGAEKEGTFIFFYWNSVYLLSYRQISVFSLSHGNQYTVSISKGKIREKGSRSHMLNTTGLCHEIYLTCHR